VVEKLYGKWTSLILAPARHADHRSIIEQQLQQLVYHPAAYDL
jgi:hypothetical protein